MAFMDIMPQVPGHTLVIPRNSAEGRLPTICPMPLITWGSVPETDGPSVARLHSPSQVRFSGPVSVFSDQQMSPPDSCR
ncbi:hypothetical protein [Seongchinamella sediminis]|uniref:hypothetical protein n=1 Tax=Seongchinamella sediminis TaxID=2283635 RepID=UPI0030846A29